MKISLQSSKNQERSACQIVIVPQQGLGKRAYSTEIVRIVKKLQQEKIFKGGRGCSFFVPRCSTAEVGQHLLLVGLEKSQDIDENLRQAFAVAYRSLEHHAQPVASINFSVLRQFVRNSGRLASVISEGLILAHYRFEDLKQPSEDKAAVQQIFLTQVDQSAEAKKGLENGRCLAESVNFARRLGDHPANFMTPSILAQEVQKQARNISGLQVRVWDKNRITKERMGGVLGVSAGSSQEPRVIIMEYKGSGFSRSTRKSKASQPICFVGKGVTFDSGGVSIKPSRNMHEMKFDMCGAAAVIGTMLAIARLKLRVHVMGLVGSAENMVGPSSVKPGDILKARNGKTMEVLNTDAEGRLILAAILSYACEQNPRCIVDVAI